MVNFFSKSKTATRHWLGQRLSAVLMLALGGYLVVSFANHGFVLPAMSDGAGSYVVVVLAVLFWVLFDHGQLGLAVIIEDYVHGAMAQRVSLFFNSLAAWVLKILTVVLAYYIFNGAVQ